MIRSSFFTLSSMAAFAAAGCGAPASPDLFSAPESFGISRDAAGVEAGGDAGPDAVDAGLDAMEEPESDAVATIDVLPDVLAEVAPDSVENDAASPDAPDEPAPLSCSPGQHTCSGECVDDVNPARGCGSSCTPCGAPQYAAPICTVRGECDFVCPTVCTKNGNTCNCPNTTCCATGSCGAISSGGSCSFAGCWAECVCQGHHDGTCVYQGGSSGYACECSG